MSGGNGYALRGVALAERIVIRSEVQANGCWQFQGATSPEGYGKMNFAGRHIAAHRAAYLSHVGPIPDGLEIDHLCRNTGCVNPAHLEPVTGLENMRRRYEARTECTYGHELTEANTRVSGGRRICRACDARRQRECKARRIATAALAEPPPP